MANLNLVFLNKTHDIPLTTSEIIADSLDKRHHDVIELIRNHEDDLKYFGHVGFKTIPNDTFQTCRNNGAFETPRGAIKDKTIAYLNEQQATLLISMMRNSEKVVKFKVALVKAFYDMKQRLAQQSQTYTPDQIAEIKDKAVKQGIAIARNQTAGQLTQDELINVIVENGYILVKKDNLERMEKVFQWWNDHRVMFDDMTRSAKAIIEPLETLYNTCSMYRDVYSITSKTLITQSKS